MDTLNLTCPQHTFTTIEADGTCPMCLLDLLQHRFERYPEWVERAKAKRLPVQTAMNDDEIVTEWQL